ncbi:Sec-independent protein translocase protein TatB [Sphingomicrobium lutaoense]|uniref:Sec-independent protein translocase protein TatB n=1 Tax=Sphingomicrobium lutaoense TaxID=515949 RepID=A0A839Z1A5_9SPHN|nr:Sec-independent protein translocase protein TatB [Sphingomicrobium lutaoense]MBB3764338.1 sec-independent protein translocase protein TatB [Sphingomicrobium lutaoense]
MFGVDGVEILVVAIAALLVIGPKDLPLAMRTVGRWVGKVRGYARHFNAGIDAVMREAELEAMEKEWREQNARIMAKYPQVESGDPGTSGDVPHGEDGKGQTRLPLDEEADKRPPGERELP